MADTFDPFDLPSSFDPLGSADPSPPSRQRIGSAASATVHHGLEPAAVRAVPADARPSTTPIGAGDRPVHLLPPVRPAGDDTVARLAALDVNAE